MEEMVYELINEIVDYTIENDVYDNIGEWEERFGVTIDEAMRILYEKLAKKA